MIHGIKVLIGFINYIGILFLRLLEHESCEKLHRDIMEQLSLRQLEIKSSEKYSYISATIRLRLKQYNNEVNQLKEKINRAYSTQLMYPFKRLLKDCCQLNL